MKDTAGVSKWYLSYNYRNIKDDFEFYILVLTASIRYYLTTIDDFEIDHYIRFDDLMKSLFRESNDKELICKNHSYTINESPYRERSENNYFEL